MATPVASSTASGVASPSAHGQAMTSTDTPIMTAWGAGAPRSRCPAVAATASTRMAGTKTPTSRSATAWMRGREACASSTARMIPASTVAAPVRVTSRTKDPCRLTVPPMAGAPGSFPTGRDSPVTSDSSTSLRPSRTSAVGRDPLAGHHLDPVAGTQLGHRDPPDLESAPGERLHPARLPRLQRREPGHRLGGPPLGGGLHVAPHQDQRDDHRGGVEVDLAAGEHLPDAVGERRPGAQRDERVHVEPAVAQAGHRCSGGTGPRSRSTRGV